MQKNLEKRFNNNNVPDNIVINNWIDENQIYPLEKNNPKVLEFKRLYELENKFIIMYSGNIGLYYDLEKLIEIIGQYRNNDNVIFAFVGDGAKKNFLEEYVNNNNLKNVKFIPYQEKENLIYSLNAADVHLVTNAKGIKGVSVPSKIYGILATNVPVFGILEEDTEAWKIIQESNAGVLAHTGNYEEIQNTLTEIIENKYDFVNDHLTGRKFVEGRYTMDKSIDKYAEAIEKL